MGLMFVVETLAAGALLRRHARVRPMIGPYFELVLPAELAIVLAGAILFRLARDQLGQHLEYLLVLPLLVLALIGVLRRWHWLIRALLHASWLGAICARVVLYSQWN